MVGVGVKDVVGVIRVVVTIDGGGVVLKKSIFGRKDSLA